MSKLLSLTAGAALVALATAPTAHAQTIKFGLKAGGSLSNLSGNLTNQSQYNNRLGFQAGAMLNFGLANDMFSIQPEVLYSQKGFKYADQQYTTALGTYHNTGSVRYDYLDVPVLVRLKVGSVFFEAGPQYSYLMNISTDRTQTYNGSVVGTAGSGTTDLSNVNRNEIGYVGGLGFQSKQGFLLGLRYNGAFTDFAKDGYSNNDFKNARNSVFQAYIGFLLGGK
ncbi:porin family protein [Hymenobacter sp. BRD67]|uniref:porin family protein n=1 Tax=Hymenobacter sp. BRD67 TaxID=2675877 RepID=UPI001566B978|nr:porin family protein [Hymenobacter sp. BRD67]QKG52192.1 PorT family protein [Hymenobacter sp. BRD67]